MILGDIPSGELFRFRKDGPLYRHMGGGRCRLPDGTDAGKFPKHTRAIHVVSKRPRATAKDRPQKIRLGRVVEISLGVLLLACIWISIWYAATGPSRIRAERERLRREIERDRERLRAVHMSRSTTLLDEGPAFE